MRASLVPLLHLCDSLFPIGAFAHSDGLEAATSSGRVRSASDLDDWMAVTLTQTLRRLDGPAVHRSTEAFDRQDTVLIAEIDDEVHTLRPASTGRRASRAMGTRLLSTWQRIRPEARLADLLRLRSEWTLPVAFGAVAAASGIDRLDAVEGYCYTRLASTISAAMRLMPIGQHEGHALLAGRLERVPALAQEIASDSAPLGAFTPALDIAAMAQQYGHSRLFRS